METLVAMLIASLSLLALATTITTASNIVQGNATTAQAYYTATSNLACMSTSGTTGDKVKITTTTKLSSSEVETTVDVTKYATAELPGKSGGGIIGAVSYMTGA